KGAKVNGVGRGYAPLHCAADGARIGVGKLLISKGADVNALGGDWNWPPLFEAIIHGRSPEFVKLLLDNGANANLADDEGKTPLMVAAQMGLLPVVETLLADKRAKLGAKDKKGHTAAWWAKFKHREVYEL